MPKAGNVPSTAPVSTEGLHARVETAAMQMVLGSADGAARMRLLKGIRTEAAAAGHAEVERAAADTIDALEKAEDASAGAALASQAIVRIQQLLGGSSAAATSREFNCEFSDSTEASPAVPLCQDRELLGDFILESRDHLAQLEVQMITLEKEPGNTEAIHTVFRAFHTIKGLAGFLDLADMREVAHETETLLGQAREGELTITADAVDAVLASADFLQAWLNHLDERLAGRAAEQIPEKLRLIERLRGAARGANRPQVSAAAIQVAEEQGDSGDRRRDESAVWSGPERRSGNERRGENAETRCVKVDTAKLDSLVDMAGELVIAQTMVRHNPAVATLHSPGLLHCLAQVARITGDLQKAAMAMRMVPIGGLFQRMNRLVRDLGRKTGKQVELETFGADTELDRNVVEELADPLMHMVRNAIDHGLETPEERRAAGKPSAGHIRLRAFHQAGHIVIEVADDGRGLDRGRILEKACRTGLISEGQNISDDAVFNLIFHPGFSTANKITDVSGRGVGMDVVKKQLQKLRGQIRIESACGIGTSFLLRLPLTLAMIDGLVVGVGRERYVVPIFSVREMLRPSAETVFTVEGRQEMALIRGGLLPVVRLSQRFHVEPRSDNPADSLLIVAEAAGRSFCLMVDELIGKQEVVIKSLGEMLKEVPGVAGGAILGDGRVGLILDLEGIFRGQCRKETA